MSFGENAALSEHVSVVLDSHIEVLSSNEYSTSSYTTVSSQSTPLTTLPSLESPKDIDSISSRCY